MIGMNGKWICTMYYKYKGLSLSVTNKHKTNTSYNQVHKNFIEENRLQKSIINKCSHNHERTIYKFIEGIDKMNALYTHIFGQRWTQLRQEKNITQSELAARLHCSISLVSTLESGKVTPSVITFSKLSDIFDISTDYLAGLTNATFRWPPKLAE